MTLWPIIYSTFSHLMYVFDRPWKPFLQQSIRAVHHGDVGPPGWGIDNKVLELAALAAGLDGGVERRVELEAHVEIGSIEGRE